MIGVKIVSTLFAKYFKLSTIQVHLLTKRRKRCLIFPTPLQLIVRCMLWFSLDHILHMQSVLLANSFLILEKTLGCSKMDNKIFEGYFIYGVVLC